MTAPEASSRSSGPPAAPPPPRPPLWLWVPVRAGLAAQLVATAIGASLLAVCSGALGASPGIREASLVVGILLVYLDTHAIGHYLVGRAVGIRFRGFGLRGTDHPENYPPLLRQVMSILPMWVALTDPASRRAASRRARAAMYAAGETSTAVCSIAAAAAVSLAGAPWAEPLLVATALWNVAAAVVVSVIDKGDYARALRSLRAG